MYASIIDWCQWHASNICNRNFFTYCNCNLHWFLMITYGMSSFLTNVFAVCQCFREKSLCQCYRQWVCQRLLKIKNTCMNTFGYASGYWLAYQLRLWFSWWPDWHTHLRGGTQAWWGRCAQSYFARIRGTLSWQRSDHQSVPTEECPPPPLTTPSSRPHPATRRATR